MIKIYYRNTRRLFVHDSGRNENFLVDTGTDLSVYPRSSQDARTIKETRISTSEGKLIVYRCIWHLSSDPSSRTKKRFHLAISNCWCVKAGNWSRLSASLWFTISRHKKPETHRPRNQSNLARTYDQVQHAQCARNRWQRFVQPVFISRISRNN